MGETLLLRHLTAVRLTALRQAVALAPLPLVLPSPAPVVEPDQVAAAVVVVELVGIVETVVLEELGDFHLALTVLLELVELAAAVVVVALS